MFSLHPRIDDTIHLDKEKSKTDAEYYRIAKQAEANVLLLTPQFLELRRYETMSANQKVRAHDLYSTAWQSVECTHF